ncbi:unnamed protein product, partial [Meganyctiphanes norvegica]
MHSSREGRDELVSLLLLYGANIESVIDDGKTPLLVACAMGRLSTVKLLIEEGANLHACDKHGNSAIQLATKKGYSELASFLQNHLSKRLQSMSLNVEASGSNLECVVCMDPRTSTVMTLPCRHAVTCQKCMDDMEVRGDNRCPLCQTQINQRIPIFIN